MLTAVLLVRWLVLSPVVVHGVSMQPTLRDGDRLLLVVYRDPPVRVDRGTAVVFEDDGGRRSVKRVVGVTGDEIALRDGVLEIDGRPAEEPYLSARRLDGVYTRPVTVPAGSVYLLGDNRTSSVDSRELGPVPLDRLVGRVGTRWWPPRR